PVLTLGLARDTGASNADGLTNDPSVTGTVKDASRIADFQVSVNGAPLVSSLGSLRDGAFTLSRSVLEVFAGRPLADGNVSVRVQATDEHGFASQPVTLTYRLDTARPGTPTPLQFAPGSDTGLPGDGITNAAAVTLLTSASSTDAEVVLFANGIEVGRAPSGGAVSFTLNPAEGKYSLVAQSIDTAANVSSFTAPLTLTVDRPLALPHVALDAFFAAGAFGAGLHTTQEVVTLTGTAEPGAVVTLDGTPVQATADNLGTFRLTDVSL